MMQLEVYDANELQYLPAARGLKLSKVWQGGLDLLLSYILDRPPGINWPDVGHGHKVILRNNIDPLWTGEIRNIDQEEEQITITALGQWVYLDDEIYSGSGYAGPGPGRLWCDTRYGKWKPTTLDHVGARRPERFQMDQENRLYIAPRKGEAFGNSPYIIGALHYLCLYDEVKRVTFSYDVALPTNWYCVLWSHQADWTGQTTLWNKNAVTESGSGDVTLSTERPIIEFAIYRAAGPNAAYTGETGDLYAKITNLKVFGTTVTTPSIDYVASDIIDQIESSTPIENDKSGIEWTGAPVLIPLYYEEGETCLDVMEDAAGFGDINRRNLAWGVKEGVLFVKIPNRQQVRYVVASEVCRRLSIKGATDKGFVTEAWGRYTDEDGEYQFTAKHYAHVTPSGIVVNTTATGDDLASNVYGVKRIRVPDFGRVSATLAVDFLKLYLVEHAHPQIQSSIEVMGEVRDLWLGGVSIMPYEMEPGHLVQISDYRAVEAEGASGVDLREWETTFLLTGLEWDNDQEIARLIPEGAPEDLQRVIEFARRFNEDARLEGYKKRSGG